MSKAIADEMNIIEAIEDGLDPITVEEPSDTVSVEESLPLSVVESPPIIAAEEDEGLEAVAFTDTDALKEMDPGEEDIDSAMNDFENNEFRTYKDHNDVHSWLDHCLQKVPKWSRKSSSSMERAIGYIELLNKCISKALRTDHNGVMSGEALDAIEKNRKKMNRQLHFLEEQIKRLSKLSEAEYGDLDKTAWPSENIDAVGKAHIKSIEDRNKLDHRERYYPNEEEDRSKERERGDEREDSNAALGFKEASGYCESHDSPKYNGECLLCVADQAREASSDPNTIQKKAHTPKLTFTVDPFIHAVVSLMIEATVSGGHNIEHVYEKFNDHYEFDDEKKLQILWTLRNMGYPFFLDISGLDFIRNYFA